MLKRIRVCILALLVVGLIAGCSSIKDAEAIPDYVRTEAKAMATVIKNHRDKDSIVFAFLSDAHCGYYEDKTNEATKLAGQLLYLIGERVPFDFIANGGDLSTGAWDTNIEMTREQIDDYTELTAAAHKNVPSVWVPGNHDDTPYMATAERLTQEDIFALIGSKNLDSGAVCPDGCNYGYLDLDKQKLRVIYLDTDDKRNLETVQTGTSGQAPAFLNAHNISGEQLQWLVENSLNFTDKTDPEQWGIVVISHVGLNVSGTVTDVVTGEVYDHSTANVATILNAYRRGESGSISHNGVTVNYDFSSEKRAVVICAVHGHDHKFSSENLDGLLTIGCPNVMNGRERESDDGNTYTKTPGTADGTAFCILTIDRKESVIYVDCVGAGYDRKFSYTERSVNQIPISTDTEGMVYNRTGYKKDTYLSSGGVESPISGITSSGFIPCKVGDILYFKNVEMTAGQDKHRILFYNADKEYLNITKTNNPGYTGFEYDENGNISVLTINGGDTTVGTAFIRICCGYIGDDSVVSVNDPIE